MIRFLFFCLFLPLSAFAQLNESDTVRFQGKISLTGVWQGGNVEFWALRGKAELSWKPTAQIVLKTQNAYLYQSFYQKKADEDILSRNFIYYNPHKRLYPFAVAWLSTNFRRKIDFRYFAGIGATYQLIHKPKHLVKIALSGVYEQTNFSIAQFNEPSYNGDFQINTWRISAWLFGKHHFENEKIVLHYEAYAQPSVGQTDNFRWQTEAGMDIKLTNKINFTTNFIYTFENIVAEKLRNEDYILTFGFSLGFR